MRREMRQNPHFWKELQSKQLVPTRQYTDSRTGKSDFERCIAMNDEAINWDDVPVVITKDQLYRICHINKYRPVPAPKRENPLRVYGQENTLL